MEGENSLGWGGGRGAEHQSKEKGQRAASRCEGEEVGEGGGSLAAENTVVILLFHWESWLGLGMTINPGKRKTRRFAGTKKKNKLKKKERKKFKRQRAH